MALSAQVIAARPAATVAAPVQSSDLALASRLSQAKPAASPAATIASGTFRRKIARHDTWSTKKPPSTGPMAEVSAPAPAHIPIARLRSCWSKVAPSIARLAGMSSAAPIP